MRDNKKIIGIIALTELKGIGPAFVKKVVSNNSFEAVNTIHEIKEITTANNKQFDDDTIYEAVERAKEIGTSIGAGTTNAMLLVKDPEFPPDIAAHEK